MSLIGLTSLSRTLKACQHWLWAVRDWEGLFHDEPLDERLRTLFCDDGTCLEENTNNNGNATDNNPSSSREVRGRWFGYALASIIVAFSLGLLAWTIWYRKTRVVRASQPIFLILILAGSIVFGSSLYPLGIDGCEDIDDSTPCDYACMAAPWLSILGWTMLFSGIYAKLRRVRIVVENAQRFRRVTIAYKDVIRPFLIMFVLNFIALLLSTIFFPLQWEINTQDSDDENSSSFGTCTFKNGIADTIGSIVFSLLTLGNILALVLALVEAYRGRNIIVEYNESRYILMASICILQALLVGFPVLLLVEDQEQALTYFITSTVTFTVCISILLFLFVPKIVAQHRNDSSLRRGSPTSMTTGLSIQKRLGTSAVSFVFCDPSICTSLAFGF
jgi:gamma-aminobutyric acid type B receptor